MAEIVKDDDFWKGFIIGQALKPILWRREPVAYLYGHVAKEGETPTHTINGVGYVGAVLPKLPEYDKKKYPYAVMSNLGTNSTGNIYCMIHLCSTLPFLEKNIGGTFLKTTGAYMYATYYKKIFGDDWYSSENGSGAYTQSNTENGGSGSVSNIKHVMWSNFDVYDADKNVVCEASDPIPIYEGSVTT